MNANFDKVVQLAAGSRFTRFRNNPFRYLMAMLLKYFNHLSAKVDVHTFWGDKIYIQLPSSLDIYLTGAKTHPSELRLTAFLMKQASDCQGFLDIGAHVGYFSLLMKKSAKPDLPIFAIEAAPRTFSLLQENVAIFEAINALQYAASNQQGTLQFLELPPKYAEYNSLQLDQYKNEAWFRKINPSICNVAAIRIDDLLAQYPTFTPTIIKVDVEGAELSVLQGMIDFISANKPMLIVEFVCKEENKTSFVEIENLLNAHGLKPYCISVTGELELIKQDIYSWMCEHKIDSENFVFQ